MCAETAEQRAERDLPLQCCRSDRPLRADKGQPLYREPLAIDRVTICERGNERGNFFWPDTTKPPAGEAYVVDIVVLFNGCGGRI